MTGNRYRKALEEVEIEFIPVRDLMTDEIYGYKVIKNFSKDLDAEKEEIYSWTVEENFFEFFISKIKDKALRKASEKGYLDKKFFYTLRANYIKDSDFLFNSFETMLRRYNLNKENICFEIKGFKTWNDIEEILDYVEEGYEFLLKEGNIKVDKSMLSLLEPHMYEVRTYIENDMIKFMKENNSKIIYRGTKGEDIDRELLLSKGIDYIYFK